MRNLTKWLKSQRFRDSHHDAISQVFPLYAVANSSSLALDLPPLLILDVLSLLAARHPSLIREFMVGQGQFSTGGRNDR